MPQFLIDKLKQEYPNNSHAVYGTLNRLGAMHGNKETAKGAAMQAKHDRDYPSGAEEGTVVDDENDTDTPGAPPPPRAPAPRPLDAEAAPAPVQMAMAGGPPPFAPRPAPAPAPPEMAAGPPLPSTSLNGPPPFAAAPAAIAPPPPSAAQTRDAALQQRLDESQKNEDAIRGQALEAAKRKIPLWRLILGSALSATNRGQGAAQMLLNPQNPAARALPIAAGGTAELRKQQEDAQTARLKEEQIKAYAAKESSLASTRELNAQTKAENAQIFKDRLAEQTSKRNQDFLTAQMKGRQEDSIYQSETAQRPAGYEFIPDPGKPGYGFAVPPAWRPASPEMLPYLAPGTKPGDMITHSEYKAATATAQRIAEEKAKAGEKPPNIEKALVDQHNPDPKISGPAKQLIADSATFAKSKQKEDKGTTVMLPTGNGGYTVQAVHPGDTIGPGAVTATGMNTANTATSQNRSRAEFAKTVTEQVPQVLAQIDALKNKIGPGAGRWQQLWVNKGGMNDPDFAGLDQDLKMLASAVVVTHFGARGGGGAAREALEKNFSEAQSPEDLKARIQHADKWLAGYAKIGSQQSPNAASPAPIDNGQRRQQYSPSTKQYRHTIDGGRTWQPGPLQ